MSVPAVKRSLKILAVLAFVAAATPTQKAGAGTCVEDYFFCDCARAAAQQCWSDYVACGGLEVEGCWETYYYQCRPDSGIDQCQ